MLIQRGGYSGYGINKAHINPDVLVKALEDSKNESI